MRVVARAASSRFREAGGKRAIVTNIPVDLKAPTAPLSDDGPYSLRCSPADARARLERLAEFGFDDAVLVIEDASEENLRAVRALWPG